MIKTLLVASACMLAVSAQAAELPQKYAEKGKVVVANMPNYPPMEFRDPATNNLMGLDIDIGRALAEQLGTEFEWSEIPFVQMMSALKTDRADMVLSGMSDLASRRDALDFVDYLETGAQFFILAENAEKFQKRTDLCGKSVGMSRRTSFPDQARAWSAEHCEAAGLPAVKIVGTEGSADARLQLRQGRVIAAMQGGETLPYIMSQKPGVYAVVGDPITTLHQGMAFSKKDTGLRDAVAAALGELMESGKYVEILKKWNLGDHALDEVLINGEPVS